MPQNIKPKDAASIILVRTRGGHHEVLLGKRGEKARFMPGYYVFPGGGVHRSDSRIKPASPLDPAIFPWMMVKDNANRASALANCAIRELHEETGLMLAASGEVGNASADEWMIWRERGLAPDHQRLRFIGRAITPTFFKIRFHARFFIASGKNVIGELGGDGELHDLGWVNMDETADLPVADITRFMLRHAHWLLTTGKTKPGMPLFSSRGKKFMVRYCLN